VRSCLDPLPSLFVADLPQAPRGGESCVDERPRVRVGMGRSGAGRRNKELLPDTPGRQRQELEFHSTLGAVLGTVKGQAAPETGRAFARARELWERIGSPSEFLRVPFGQSGYHATRGELDLALRLDEDLLRLSGQRADSAGLVLGHMCSGRDLMIAGRFAPSRVASGNSAGAL
jgi:hypothetical protein